MQNSKEYQIKGLKITINIQAIGKGLYNLHVENNCLGPLAFGMLDFKIMECAENNLIESITGKFKNVINQKENLIKDIKRAVSDIMGEVSKHIYSLAKMVV